MLCSVFIASVIDKNLDIKILTHELKDVTTDWFQLGVQLGVKPAKLQQICQDCGGKTEQCNTEMLNCWLQGDLEASWGKVVEALQRRDHFVLAQQLQRKYMHHPSNRGKIGHSYVHSNADSKVLDL